MALTSRQCALNLVIAFNYGSRAEIAKAARRLAERVLEGTITPEDITPELLTAALDTHGVPDPDLLIRTSGELRLSNFLLWQSAYTEFVFLDAYWPDFGRELLEQAIDEFRKRDRRFGGVSPGRPADGRAHSERPEPMNEHERGGTRRRRTARSALALGSDFAPRLPRGWPWVRWPALCTFPGAAPFAVLVVVVTLLLSWEWSRLVHGREADIVLAVHACAALAAAVLAAFGYVGLGLLALPIGAILATLLSLGRNSVFAALGVFYAGLPAVALIWLRSDATLGLLAVVFLIVVVIAADTGAFLAGRLLGGPKLWPRVSPNKTWAGLIGALAASAVVRRLLLVRRCRALAAAAGGDRRRAVVGRPGRRSRGIGPQAPLRRQGCEPPDPRPWRHHGSRRRPGRSGIGRGPDRLRRQRAFTGARAAARVVRMGGAACRRRAQSDGRDGRGERAPRAGRRAQARQRARRDGLGRRSTLDLIGRNPHMFEVVALTGNSNVDALAELAVRHGARAGGGRRRTQLRRAEGASGRHRHRGRRRVPPR